LIAKERFLWQTPPETGTCGALREGKFAMREIVKSLIGTAAAVVCISGASVSVPTAASAQNIQGLIGGAMRAYGVPGGAPGYRGPAQRSTSHSSSHKDKDAQDEDNASDRKTSDRDRDSRSRDRDSGSRDRDTGRDRDRDASADSKPRRELSAPARDDHAAAPAASISPSAKAEPPKSSDDEPSFSPSR
jgi:hypothetical protein